MDFFHPILTDTIKTAHLLESLAANHDLWSAEPIRTSFEGTPHAEVSDILLRFNPVITTIDEVADAREAIDYPAYAKLMHFRRTVMSIFAYVGGERLGRVMITKLPPGGKITPHRDQGGSPEYYDRFHVPLQGGGWFRCGQEVVRMNTGDLWWVQNLVEHEVLNDSDHDRIHLIVDARCADWSNSILR
jgi:quercetin dioxygenase-like cupin family protein